MSPPIRDGLGNDIGAIRLGDGTEISEVRTGAGDVLFSAGSIPDSVVNQYTASNFASPWSDNIGSADMSVTGLTSSMFSNSVNSVSGDGTDDFGSASAEGLGSLETWGFAFTISGSSANVSGTDAVAGKITNDSADIFFFGVTDDKLRLFWRIDSNTIDVSGGAIMDRSVVPVVVNKTGDAGGDIEMYTGDMSTDTATVSTDDGLDHANNNLSSNEWGFYARRDPDRGPKIHLQADIGVFEFNTDPYSFDERESFVARRPEL